MIADEINYLIPYTCSSCGESLETDGADWPDWLICPACEMPSRRPDPPHRSAYVTAGSFYIGPETEPSPPAPHASRLDWLDQIAPRPNAPTQPEGRHRGSPPIPPISPVESPSTTAPNGEAPAPSTTEPTRPQPTMRFQTSGSYNPSPETLQEAFARPARVSGPAPIPRLQSDNLRIAAGVGLCLCTVGGLFKMLDGDTNWALVFGAAAVLSLFMLVRLSSRSYR